MMAPGSAIITLLVVGFPVGGYDGCLHKGAQDLKPPSPKFSWKPKLTFLHPVAQVRMCWLTWTPTSWAGVWAAGCWVCNRAGVKTAYGRIAVDSLPALKICNFLAHHKSRAHAKALEAFQHSMQPSTTNSEADMGAVSGRHDGVPRIDMFVKALGIVEGFSSYADLQRRGHQDIGSCLAPGSDDSRKSAKKLLVCTAEPFYQIDRKVMRNAVQSSIAIDKSGDVLLLYGRCLVREGLYDFLIGTESNVGHEIADTVEAVTNIIRRTSTVRKGKRYCTMKADAALPATRSGVEQ